MTTQTFQIAQENAIAEFKAAENAVFEYMKGKSAKSLKKDMNFKLLVNEMQVKKTRWYNLGAEFIKAAKESQRLTILN